ncbi:MAG TPA: hypothetical protein VFG54_07530 [Prolixibacteraceae bacterium]|nr:hypothetical protein [Prolixibacteraceae bacterium]
MGLSFHYSGRIANPDSLPDLIDEVVDICKTFKWKYHVFERQFPKDTIVMADHNQKLYGICFTPPECEMVDVCFLSNGRMSGPMLLQNWGHSRNPKEKEYLYMISVKTQYAGIEIHRNIIQLFRYLKEKYLTDFTMSDEGEYWETNDEAVLKENFKRYTDLIDGFALALESQNPEKGEDLETYLLRLAQQLHDRRKGKE